MHAHSTKHHATAFLLLSWLVASCSSVNARVPLPVRGDGSLVRPSEIEAVASYTEHMEHIDQHVLFAEVTRSDRITVFTGCAIGGNKIVFNYVRGSWRWDGIRGFWSGIQ